MAAKCFANDIELDSERILIERAKRDASGFQLLFNKFYDKIFNYALRRTGDAHLADDIAANTFLKAFDQIGNFKWRGISISAWLYRIATNEINQLHRKMRRTTALTSDMAAKLADDRYTDSELLEIEETIAKNDQFRKVHAALSRLKTKYQSVLTLRYFENKSIKEIAAILDISENTVKTHIHRGLNKLKEYL